MSTESGVNNDSEILCKCQESYLMFRAAMGATKDYLHFEMRCPACGFRGRGAINLAGVAEQPEEIIAAAFDAGMKTILHEYGIA